MRKHIFTTAFMALAAVLLITGTSSFAKPKNKKGHDKKGLVWADTLYDFGKVNMGPELVHKFTFKNKSSKIVTILKAEPGCSCTVSEFTSDPIKKGQSGSVTAKYTTQNRQGFFKKFIKVTFADGSTQELIITGTVVTP